MKYRRMPIEIESPAEFGYEKIKYHLADSTVYDASFKDVSIDFSNMKLCYGDHRGNPELRNLIAQEGEELDTNDVLITAGAVMALFIVNTALLSPCDHMIVMHPNYVTNIETPRAVGAEVEFCELNFEDKWQLNIDELAVKFRPNTKLVSITLPNNPTGSNISIDDLQKIITLVEEHNCFLLLDETYRDMTFGSLLPLGATLSDRIISVSSMSKSYGFSGIRTGWIMTTNNDLMDIFFGAKEQMAICGPSIDEEIACYVMKQKDSFLKKFKIRIEERFNVVSEWMNEQNILEWIPPTGGVVCFPRIKKEIATDLDAFYTTLRDKYKTYVGPGHWFEMDRRHFRIGFGTPEIENLRAGLECIGNSLEEAKM